MELNWSTFILEIINFLVLVWILKRFLYRPVLKVLETRRQNIEAKLNEANSLRSEADELQQKYKGRLDEWLIEKQQAREALQQEIQKDKTRQLEQLRTELASEKQKANAIEERNKADSLRQLQLQAHTHAAQFASRLLNSVADQTVEAKLFALLIESLNQLDEAHLSTLRKACEKSIKSFHVTSTYPLSDQQCQQLETTLSRLCDKTLNIDYSEDASLIAGLRICIGDWVLRFNLQDELSSFAELSHENPIS